MPSTGTQSKANLQPKGTLNKNFSNMIGDQGNTDIVRQQDSMQRFNSNVPAVQKEDCYDGSETGRNIKAPSEISEDMWGELPKYQYIKHLEQ